MCLLSPLTLALSHFSLFSPACLLCKAVASLSQPLFVLSLPHRSLPPSLCSQTLLTQTSWINAATSMAPGSRDTCAHLRASGGQLQTTVLVLMLPQGHFPTPICLPQV